MVLRMVLSRNDLYHFILYVYTCNILKTSKLEVQPDGYTSRNNADIHLSGIISLVHSQDYKAVR